MKTWLLWTHYDCEVYATLHPTQDACWQQLKTNWLDDGTCDGTDCECENDINTNEGISAALEYHFDEMMYSLEEVEVPLAYQGPTTAEKIMANSLQLEPEPTPASTTVTAQQAGDLLTALQTYQENG
jgi:hypothetical protein